MSKLLLWYRFKRKKCYNCGNKYLPDPYGMVNMGVALHRKHGPVHVCVSCLLLTYCDQER